MVTLGVLRSANVAHAVTASAFHFVASGGFLDALPASRAYSDLILLQILLEQFVVVDQLYFGHWLLENLLRLLRFLHRVGVVVG